MDSEEFDAKPKLGEVKHEGRDLIAGWPFVQPTPDIRIYYRLSERERSGFDFTAIEYAGHICTDIEKGGFGHPEARFDYVLYGWAAFDGIRHLHFREDADAGYFNYPHLDDLIAVLQALRALELEHCWDVAARQPPAGPSSTSNHSQEGRE